jgi:hypothetical protein
MNDVVAHVAGHIELKELSVAAGFLEGRKVFPAVSDRVKMVILAI